MGGEVDYEAVFRAGPVLALVLTPDFVIVAVNDVCLKAIRRTRDDLVGRNLFAAFPLNPSTVDPGAQSANALRASLEQVVATGEPDVMPLQRYDVETPGKPGVFEERYWSSVNIPVFGPGGALRWILLSSHEVTGFIQTMRRYGEPGTLLDAGLYAQAGELHNLIEELGKAHTRQLLTASALRAAVQRQRQLVLDTSHDLRNPIAGLLTELEVALSEPGVQPQQVLRKLLRNVERLNEIVTDVLDLARLDTAAPSAAETVDLGAFVAEELGRRVLAATVVSRIEQDVVVPAPRVRLARLLGNLLDNAERHTSTTIEVIVTADPPEAVLEVVDDGPGIPPAQRERIFERRYRGDDARRRDPGGTGLGLPIAREIAQAYGGRLEAADHPTGACFVLRLPLAVPPEAAPGEPTGG
ncbi:PAS domain-containing sensor histidine kinase [Thermoactinospora rubra]|uniref:PAS domain-containing sensor histidine kinase n=1 Tax=Thermoactinospora rubra TaxID=1088767 RepID=UPI000A111598|nr:PAS domain-containing sensor histidine kinase [Thermoactinospora rubra]